MPEQLEAPVQQMTLGDLARFLGLQAIDRGSMALGFPGDVERLLGVGRPSMNEDVPIGLGRVFGQWGTRTFPGYAEILPQLSKLEKYLPADTGWRPPNEQIKLSHDDGFWGLAGLARERFAPPGPNTTQNPTTYADWRSLQQQPDLRNILGVR